MKKKYINMWGSMFLTPSNICQHPLPLLQYTNDVSTHTSQATIHSPGFVITPALLQKRSRTRGTRDQIANIHWIIQKAGEFQTNIYFCFIDYAKSLTVWITTNYEQFFKRWEYQTTFPASWEICMQVKKHQLEPDVEKQTGSKLRKVYYQGCILPRCILSPCLWRVYYAKCQAGWSTSWNQDCLEKYQ